MLMLAAACCMQYGSTLLHMAAQYDRAECDQLLLAHGADADHLEAVSCAEAATNPNTSQNAWRLQCMPALSNEVHTSPCLLLHMLHAMVGHPCF